jgi:hypothetical protein
MRVFEAIVHFLLTISVATNAFCYYLRVNKVWTRKHEPLVAESNSPTSTLIWICVILPFCINYMLQKDWQVTLSYFFRLSLYVFLFLVSIGFWVKDPLHKGIWQKIIKAFKQEVNESTNLIKALNSPSAKKELINILYRIAWIDEEIDEKEQQYIQMFADSWEIDVRHLFTAPPPEKGIDKLNKIREEVITYLKLQPPKEQALGLSDVVQILINIDGQVTQEEELIGAEISSMLTTYGSQQGTTLYKVIVHPTKEQEVSLSSVLSSATKEYILGNQAYVSGIFQTRSYAEALVEDYRKQNLFTVMLQLFQ